ncbi:MAG: U32 family peptidase, partial [Lachnospiraceae bacterium]|nr:U32 family peptidase [Lachnospiraceae bacterium]
KNLPDLPLHMSTQGTVNGKWGVDLMKDFGIRRIVPARELSLQELRTLRQEDPQIEIETFIHGAMCYSCSGRCLMSSFLGGRSGNRGRCAGTCRLPFRVLDGDGIPAGPDARRREVWPLSMKDMCVLPILPDLIDAGVNSFKIEGRMKKPVYAAGVTAVYRKYIDRFYAWDRDGRQTPWEVEEADLDMLRHLYIRTDLGTGYYHTRNGRDLITIGRPGYAGTDEALEEKIRRKYLTGLPRVAVEGRAVFRIGEPARLRVRLQSGTAVRGISDPASAASSAALEILVTGAPVQQASGRPMDTAELERRLSRTGDSLFDFARLDVEADPQIFLPVSAVNALRREALQALENLLAEKKMPGGEKVNSVTQTQAGDAAVCSEDIEEKSGKQDLPDLWALVSSADQMEAAVRAGASCVIIDGEFMPPAGRFSLTGSGENLREKTQKGNNYALQSAGILLIRALPPVLRTAERDMVRSRILKARGQGFSGILVRNLEELQLAKEVKYADEIIADSSLYSWNGRSMGALLEDCGRIICSLELNQKDIDSAARAVEAAGAGPVLPRLVLPVYGRIPMMETAGCVRKTEKACDRRGGFWYLEDRMGKRLPVRCRCEACSNTIYNAVPLSLHQFAGRGLFARASALLCMFTTEGAHETEEITGFFDGLRSRAGSPTGSAGRRPGLMQTEEDRGDSGEKTAACPDIRSQHKKYKKKDKNRNKSSKARTGDLQQALPFTEFTNGHFRSGAL